MIVLDLEWNSGTGKKPLHEILQIGAVRVDLAEKKVIDWFNVYIKPCVHQTMSPAVMHLPDLERSAQSTLDFTAAYTAFIQWCGEETEFASWGNADIAVLRQNCTYWGIPLPMCEKTYDIQAAFSHLLDAGNLIALGLAVDYCAIPTPYCFHNALNDALYAAMIGEWMGMRTLTADLPPKSAPKAKKKRGRNQKKLSFSECAFQPQPKRKAGSFVSIDSALNSRGCRKLSCPVCGRKIWITHWYAADPVHFFSDFCCPHHGRFICRLSFFQNEKEEWNVRVAVPSITPLLLEQWQLAKSSGSQRCKPNRSPKKKPSYRPTVQQLAIKQSQTEAPR